MSDVIGDESGVHVKYTYSLKLDFGYMHARNLQTMARVISKILTMVFWSPPILHSSSCASIDPLLS